MEELVIKHAEYTGRIDKYHYSDLKCRMSDGSIRIFHFHSNNPMPLEEDIVELSWKELRSFCYGLNHALLGDFRIEGIESKEIQDTMLAIDIWKLKKDDETNRNKLCRLMEEYGVHECYHSPNMHLNETMPIGEIMLIGEYNKELIDKVYKLFGRDGFVDNDCPLVVHMFTEDSEDYSNFIEGELAIISVK